MIDVNDVLTQKLQRLQITAETRNSVEVMEEETFPRHRRNTRGSVMRREKYVERINKSLCRKHALSYPNKGQCPNCIQEAKSIQLFLEEIHLSTRVNERLIMNATSEKRKERTNEVDPIPLCSLEKRYSNGEDIVADPNVSDASLRRFFETAYYQDLHKKYLKRDFNSCLAARVDFTLISTLSRLLETKNVKAAKYNLRYIRETEVAALDLAQSLHKDASQKYLVCITSPVQRPWLLLAQGIVPDLRQRRRETDGFLDKLEIFLDSRLSSSEDIKVWFETECSLSEVASLRYWIIYC